MGKPVNRPVTIMFTHFQTKLWFFNTRFFLLTLAFHATKFSDNRRAVSNRFYHI